MPDSEMLGADTVSIEDVAEDVITLETCERAAAHFAGGAHVSRYERDRNPFIGWETQAVTMRCYRLRNVVLDRSLMIFLKDGRVIAETNYLQSDDSIAKVRVRPESLVKRKAGKVAATCFDHWDTNYYHWMAHTVPAIHVALQRHGASGIELIVPQLSRWQQESLALLGVPEHACIETVRDRQYFLPEVEYYDFVAGRSDFSISPLSRSAYLHMSAAVATTTSRPRRIYIDRGVNTNRRMPNEAVLVARLMDLGFYVVRPEELNLHAQIALFKGASMVIGQLGAGLANIAFCQPGTVVYELIPEHHQNPCFLAMALQGGLQYWGDVFETGIERRDHISQWAREIDVDRVIRRIEELEALIPAGRLG